ncbi:MAG: Adenosylmethionine-8-amino-7-oxononanoate aminotransferase [Gammaproteobacteria bacterium]|nr:Adenosylmethionine-8-amino-7-oxononanoate aminotransferase [Gammaproteobacteria bacterium]
MNEIQMESWRAAEREHAWHPYAGVPPHIANIPIVGARGMTLQLADGRMLIDGMSSWWAVIHGYNHPVLNAAIQDQLNRASHVMFGGITHPAAAELVERLVEITPAPLQTVFLADSGSVSVEVALKMAIQYWYARGKPGKQRFIALRRGYHGDTSGAMSVSDPENGMHSLFADSLLKQWHAEAPQTTFHGNFDGGDLESMAALLEQFHDRIAGVIVEPIVQGAGGMRFYHPGYLKGLHELCERWDVLLIADEIATNFGRTGRLFACEHAGIAPDIMCLGKALTGGYMTLAAAVTTEEVSHTISNADPGVFMHGPTFMANPLACAAAIASIRVLLDSPWEDNIAAISRGLEAGLRPYADVSGVRDIRVLGAIGVIEMEQPVDIAAVNHAYIDQGVWLRPFNKLIYTMPAFIATEKDIRRITQAMCDTVKAAVAYRG